MAAMVGDVEGVIDRCGFCSTVVEYGWELGSRAGFVPGDIVVLCR
jgi:hypothetical protein